MATGIVKTSTITILIGILAYIIANFKSEIKCGLLTTAIQLTFFAKIYFGGALFMEGISGDKPALNINLGYWNDLQMKSIWLSRFFLQDQFLFKSWEQRVHGDILNKITEQYKQLNLTVNSITTQLPTFQWGNIDRETFVREYVAKGAPVVIKGFPSKASKIWSADYFASNYGDHRIDVINTSSVVSVSSTLSEFVRQTQLGEPLYLRSLSDIFDKHKELIEDVGFHTFDDYMEGTYMTSQIFMNNNLKVGSGTSYHCANFNNLFFQIVGRKKWTFVDPQYEALMYPMFNAKVMDVASFVTTIALAQPDMMEKYFPLYKLAPKMVVTLEPGDVLMNPPWNWHMVTYIYIYIYILL
jgi:hypothetical protein